MRLYLRPGLESVREEAEEPWVIGTDVSCCRCLSRLTTVVRLGGNRIARMGFHPCVQIRVYQGR
jgi:hypothetical protein